MLNRILSAIGLEKRSTIGVNGWPVPISASAVTPTTAQGVSAVYACVQAISETTASLPLILFKRNGDDRERASDHPLYRVLHDMANPEQTALEAREYMQACVLLRGNAFARLVRGWERLRSHGQTLLWGNASQGHVGAVVIVFPHPLGGVCLNVVQRGPAIRC